MTAARRLLNGTSIAAALLLAAGCSGIRPLPAPDPTTPDPTTTDPTTTATVWVTGSVTDDSGEPASVVVLSFDSGADRAASRSTISGRDGAYRVRLLPGRYTVSCTSLDGECSPVDADGDSSMTLDVASGDSVDFVVERTSPTPDPEPSPDPDPTPDPEPTADDLASQCRAGGYNVCGRVTQGGRPVAGVILEAKFGRQHQEVTTDENGLYAMRMQIPDGVLLCEGTEEMMNDAVDCSAVGEGEPVYIDSSVTGRIVDFAADPS